MHMLWSPWSCGENGTQLLALTKWNEWFRTMLVKWQYPAGLAGLLIQKQRRTGACSDQAGIMSIQKKNNSVCSVACCVGWTTLGSHRLKSIRLVGWHLEELTHLTDRERWTHTDLTCSIHPIRFATYTSTWKRPLSTSMLVSRSVPITLFCASV